MRLAIGLLFIIGSTCAQGQERVIDLREIYKVVDAWTEALNDKNLATLEGLYDEEEFSIPESCPGSGVWA